MPKVNITLPLSALFGVVKPSGPTSMSIVNEIKKLVVKSSLFVEESKLAAASNKKKGKYGREAVKIGQGGTLDPLADGVLGTSSLELRACVVRQAVILPSCRDWEGDEEVVRIS